MDLRRFGLYCGSKGGAVNKLVLDVQVWRITAV